MEAVPSPRERVYEAALVCLGRFGMGKTTVDDVARQSGLSRATIYRHFPGGRDQLVREVVAWEMGRFFHRLGEAVAAAPDLATLLEEALIFAHRAVAGHEVLQRMLRTEPDRVVPLITVQAGRILPLISGFLVPYVARDRDAGRVRHGVDVDAAAEYLARMVLSFVNAPGRCNLDDRADVRDRVRLELLGAILIDDETKIVVSSQ